MTYSPTLLDLSPELHELIAEHLDDDELVATRATCQALYLHSSRIFLDRHCADRTICLLDEKSWERELQFLQSRLRPRRNKVKFTTKAIPARRLEKLELQIRPSCPSIQGAPGEWRRKEKLLVDKLDWLKGAPEPSARLMEVVCSMLADRPNLELTLNLAELPATPPTPLSHTTAQVINILKRSRLRIAELKVSQGTLTPYHAQILEGLLRLLKGASSLHRLQVKYQNESPPPFDIDLEMFERLFTIVPGIRSFGFVDQWQGDCVPLQDTLMLSSSIKICSPCELTLAGVIVDPPLLLKCLTQARETLQALELIDVILDGRGPLSNDSIDWCSVFRALAMVSSLQKLYLRDVNADVPGKERVPQLSLSFCQREVTLRDRYILDLAPPHLEPVLDMLAHHCDCVWEDLHRPQFTRMVVQSKTGLSSPYELEHHHYSIWAAPSVSRIVCDDE